MLFSFTVNQAMYLALAREDAGPLVAALEALPPIPQDCQWAHFVRNHDELTLDKLSTEEREEVFAAFGPDPGMQMYGRGLRRRLPAMLGGDQRRMRMVYSLMFSLPGTPVLFYGEEIGMAENLAIEGRYAVRSPMQWSDEPHAGFTTGDEPCRPLPADGPFGYPEVNVARQRREPGSLLNWMERLIRRRRECPELGWGEWTLLPQDEPGGLRAPRRLGRLDDRRGPQPRRPRGAGAARARRRGRARRPASASDDVDARRRAGARARAVRPRAGSGCAGRASASRPSAWSVRELLAQPVARSANCSVS